MLVDAGMNAIKSASNKSKGEFIAFMKSGQSLAALALHYKVFLFLFLPRFLLCFLILRFRRPCLTNRANVQKRMLFAVSLLRCAIPKIYLHFSPNCKVCGV